MCFSTSWCGPFAVSYRFLERLGTALFGTDSTVVRVLVNRLVTSVSTA
jgi:hypothetical protein